MWHGGREILFCRVHSKANFVLDLKPSSLPADLRTARRPGHFEGREVALIWEPKQAQKMTAMLFRISRYSHRETFELASIFCLIIFILEIAKRTPSFVKIVKEPTFAEDAKLRALRSYQQFDVATRTRRCYHLIAEHFEGYAVESGTSLLFSPNVIQLV